MFMQVFGQTYHTRFTAQYHVLREVSLPLPRIQKLLHAEESQLVKDSYSWQNNGARNGCFMFNVPYVLQKYCCGQRKAIERTLFDLIDIKAGWYSYIHVHLHCYIYVLYIACSCYVLVNISF